MGHGALTLGRSSARPSRAADRFAGRLSALASLLIVSACAAADGMPAVDAGPVATGPRVQFEVIGGTLAFGSLPFPDDLYRDAEGAIRVAPGHGVGAQRLEAELLQDMAALDGFSPTAPIFVFVDGQIDPATLPSTAGRSVEADASVFLLDIDPSSPGAFSRVPIECRFVAGDRRLSVRPTRGEPLSGGRKYALVMTSRVLSPDGEPLRPSVMYEAVLAADSVPAESSLARVYAAHINAISAVQNVGVPRAEIASLSVFTVQNVATGLERIVAAAEEFALAPLAIGQVASGDGLTALFGTPVPATDGVDAPAGTAHENIGWFIQGTASVPGLLARAAGEVGRFETDAVGALVIKRVETLPFSLSLPLIPSSAVDTVLPLVVFQHGLGRDRSDVVPLANELNAAGYAVLAIDAPYHGLRHPGAADLVHRFGDLSAPDGFSDTDGAAAVPFVLGAVDAGGDRGRLHPAYLRDALRQNVADWLVVLRTLTQQPSQFAQVSGLPSVSFATDRIGFVGIDIGAQVGVMLTTVDARIDASILALSGGGLAEWLVDTPALTPWAGELFAEFGVDVSGIDFAADPPMDWPAFAFWQSIADSGDALAFAPTLRRKSRDLLMVMAADDEWVSNRTTEALAAALRLPVAGAVTTRHVTLEHADTPVAPNKTIAGELSTQALFVHVGATHTVFTNARGESRFEPSSGPPFAMRPTATAVDNPIGSALTQAVFFFESWRNGSATVIDPVDQQRRAAP